MENKRAFFRIGLYNIPIQVTCQKKGLKQFYDGIIKDISGNGVGFYLDEELPRDSDIEYKIEFKIGNLNFKSEVEIAREGKEKNDYFYGTHYINIKENEKSKLSSILFRLDAERRK